MFFFSARKHITVRNTKKSTSFKGEYFDWAFMRLLNPVARILLICVLMKLRELAGFFGFLGFFFFWFFVCLFVCLFLSKCISLLSVNTKHIIFVSDEFKMVSAVFPSDVLIVLERTIEITLFLKSKLFC